MATSSNRDVTMTLSVETLGQENIKTLQSSVANLAKEGGDAAPEFQQLADEIGRIGEQSQAIAAFKDLATQTDALANKQQEAATKVSNLADKLDQAKQATAAAATEQRDASATLLAAQRAYDTAGSSLKQLNADYKAGTVSAESYGTQTAELTAKQGEQRNRFADLRSELKLANAALSEAESAQGKLVTQYDRADSALTKANGAIREHNSALSQSSAAAAQLGTSTENVATSEAQLLQALNASRTAALSRAAAMDQVKQADTSAKSAVDSIANAFRTVGVRSAQELEAEIVQVRAAMDMLKGNAGLTGSTLSTAFASGEAKIKTLERQLRETNGTLTLGDKTAKLFSNSLGQIAAGNVVADGVGYLVNKVKQMGQAFLDAVVQGDQLKRGLNAIYKDTAIAAQQIDFLRKSSSESGVAFGSLSNDFVRFSAAMKMANIPMEQSNALFKSVTAVTASLGMDAQATAGALNALGQMASKGTVSMEELRQQLGDRLPGALGLAASAMGISQGQLIALVSSGQLATRDFVVPFTQALNQMKGETDGLVPSWERLKGVLSETAQSMGDAGGVTLMTQTLRVLGGIVGYVAIGLSTIVEGLFLVGAASVATAARLSGDTKAWEFFGQQVEKSTNRLVSQSNALNNFIDPSRLAAEATDKHAQAMTANTAEVVKSINATAGLDAAQRMAALSIKLAADATLDAGAKIVQYNVAAAELLKLQAAQTDGYVKLAKAAKDEGNTLVENARLTGDNTAVKAAAAQAAQMYAAALDKAAASQATETAMLVAQRAEQVKSAEGRAGGVAAIKTQIDALDLLITKSKAETEQSTQSAVAAHAEVQVRQLQVETLKDHSAQVDVLKKAMDSAAVTLREYQVLALNGKKTEEEVKAARENLTRATVLYNDALGDTVTKLQAKQIADKANATVTEITLNAQKAYYKAMQDSAKAVGDYNLALYASIEQKKIDIKIIEAKVAAMKAEADGNIAVAKAELAVLEASGKLDPVKRAQIEASIKIAGAKKKEADALGLVTGALEAEIVRLRNGSNANRDYANSTNEVTSALERQNATLEANISAQEKKIDLEDRQKALDIRTGKSMGSVDQVPAFDNEAQAMAWKAADEAQRTRLGNSSGSMLSEAMLSWKRAEFKAELDAAIAKEKTAMMEEAVRAGFNVTQAGSIATQYMAQRNNGANPGTFSEYMSKGNNSPGGVGGWGSNSPGKQSGTGDQSGTATNHTYTVNVVINGVSTPINVASEADAQALIAALQRAKGNAGG